MSAEGQVGARIRKFRENRELTQEELAQRTGLDVNFIQAVEDEDIYPSLGPLLKLARALGTRLGTFLDDQHTDDPLIVRLADRQRQIVTHRGQGAPADLMFHSLGRGKTDRHMEPFFVEIVPDENDPGLSSHEGEEFIVVVKGRVKLVYGGDVFELGVGDSMYYNSIVPHHVGAAGGEKAEIYAVLYIPE